jgi:hypothetical protein
MKAFLDASAIIDFMHGDERLRGVVSEMDEVFVSTLTSYEVLVGEKVKKRANETELFLDESTDVPFGKRHMKMAREISRALSKSEKPINLMDIMVAGQALVMGAAIITNDKDFKRMSEVFELKTIFVR